MLINCCSTHIPLKDKSVHCVPTSPPYFGHRDYGLSPQIWGGWAECRHVWEEEERKHSQDRGGNYGKGMQLTNVGTTNTEGLVVGQFCQRCSAWRGSLGNEPTMEMYIAHMVEIGREIWRVLKDDGIFWLNLGDSYASSGQKQLGRNDAGRRSETFSSGGGNKDGSGNPGKQGVINIQSGLKPKQLMGIPWRVAMDLQDDGWYLRRDVIWSKANPMPESVTDRPTTSHEYVFIFTKKARYFYDNVAVRESEAAHSGNAGTFARNGAVGKHVIPGQSAAEHRPDRGDRVPAGRNLRSVWTVATESYPGAHFATWPKKLVAPMIKASTSQRGVCGECGSQWERVIESKRVSNEKQSANNKMQSEAVFARGGNQANKGRAGDYTIKTLGYRPTCTCYRTRNKKKRDRQDLTGAWLRRITRGNAPTVPAIVLDPFCGSGTTGEVARQLGSQFIGLDLSAEYLVKNALPRAEGKTSAAALAELPLFAGL